MVSQYTVIMFSLCLKREHYTRSLYKLSNVYHDDILQRSSRRPLFFERRFTKRGIMNYDDNYNNLIIMNWYNKKGKLHRIDGPALIYYYNNKISYVVWYCDGKINRKYGPARIRFRRDGGELVEEWWYVEDKINRLNFPAHFEYYYSNGKIYTENWYENDLLHRSGDLPAIITYGEDGIIYSEIYYMHGLYCRADDKPTKISYHENGLKKSEIWIIYERVPGMITMYYAVVDRNPMFHRLNGPAIVDYWAESGNKKNEEWYIEGKCQKIIIYDELGDMFKCLELKVGDSIIDYDEHSIS